ncbi:MAG: SUMF1/EgtB/PvdO family nonheme iron enzyme, partial [Desulfobacteraceae bacterium]
LEDTELEEAEGEEEITDDAYEDVEVVDGEGEAEEGATESGEGEGEDEDEQVLDGWNFLEDEPQGAREDPERRRILSEEFNTSLAAMDRFFNAYILVPEGLYPNVGRAISTEDDMEERMRLPAFYIGRFPVTNALFEVFVEKTGYTTMAEKEGYGTVYQGRYCRVKDERTGKQTLYCSSGIVSSRIRGACWYQPTGPGSTLRGRRNHPVVQVSLEDAMAFAAWTGKRLPTEQEWEAAMRTQEGFLYPWGNEWKKDACNVEETGVGETSNVDRFMANANTLGIADGLGNVLEWTMTVARGEDGNRRMSRGAGWIAGNTASLLSGTAFSPKTHSNLLGFRCVAF